MPSYSKGLAYAELEDGTYAVYGIGDCTDTDIVIPPVYNGAAVSAIGDRAFRDCTSLASINVDANNTVYMSDDGNLYIKEGKVLKRYSAGKTAESFTVPDDVTGIGASAFDSCINLKSIIIPEGVKSIGSSAFSGCNSLVSVTFENTSGWWVANSSTATSGTEISASALADAATATTYLKSTYLSSYWQNTAT
jgi:hypothetical protein